MSTETLAPEIGWEPSGHLSEVALTAVADGEDTLLDATMRAHLEACDACAAQLGQVALRSADVAGAFAQVSAARRETASPAELAMVSPVGAMSSVGPMSSVGLAAGPVNAAATSRARRKLPLFAIAAALGIALVGIAPSLFLLRGEVTQTLSVLRKVAPSFVRMLPQALARAWDGPRGLALIVMWALAAGLVAAGFGIAKRASKKALVNGGRQ